MIEPFLKLLAKLTQLVKPSKEAEEKTFELLIEPMYKDMETIHKDYLKLFEKCKQAVEDGTGVDDIVSILSSARAEHGALRDSVRLFVYCYIENSQLYDYRFFFKELERYLSLICREIPPLMSSESIGTFQKSIVGMYPLNPTKRKILADHTENILKSLRVKWEDISKEYDKLLA